jgi:hypothetical protein
MQFGGAGGIRTPDPCIRSVVLYRGERETRKVVRPATSFDGLTLSPCYRPMQWAWCCGCDSASLNLRGSRERQQSGTKSGRERDPVLATHYLANDSEGVLVWALLQWPIEIFNGSETAYYRHGKCGDVPRCF